MGTRRPISAAENPLPSLIPVAALAVRVMPVPAVADGVSVVVVALTASHGPSANKTSLIEQDSWPDRVSLQTGWVREQIHIVSADWAILSGARSALA